MTTPLWKYPGVLNGRIEASNSLLASVLSSYAYGRTGGYWSEYDAAAGDYAYEYYEGYGYYTGHVWCAGEDWTELPDYRFEVGDYAAVYQTLINDLHTIDYVEYLCELRLSERQPQEARRLATSATVEFYDDTTGATYPFGKWNPDVSLADRLELLALGDLSALLKADVPILILPEDATDLFTPDDEDRIVEITGGANAGVYRISSVPWNQGNVQASPGAGEYLNGRIAILELAAAGSWSATGAVSTTVEMLGLRWVARAYFDGDERNYLEEGIHQPLDGSDPVAGRHSWARTMHVHCSKSDTAKLRTIRFEVSLEAVDSSYAQVAGADGMSCRVPAPALYLDELYRIDGEPALAVLNAVPQQDETAVQNLSLVRLHVASFTTGATLSSTVKVYLTRSSDQTRRLAYDQAGSGFQAPYDGARSLAMLQKSPDAATNDELLLTLDPTFTWTSLEMVLVEVEAENSLGETLSTSYYFTIEDLTAPTIEEILWLTPRKARLKFDEPVLATDDPGGSRFIVATLSGVEILSTSVIVLGGVTPSSDWIGYKVSIANSYPENAGPWTITAVNTTTKQITLNTSTLRPDDGMDRASDGTGREGTGTLVQQRDIKASVSPYWISTRLDEEGLNYAERAPERVQCAFCPIPVAASAVTADELPAGADTRQYVYLTFQDDISYGRLYTVNVVKVEDLYDNAIVSSSLDFASPSFGRPVDRKVLWSNGIIPPTDRAADMEADGYLRKLSVVLQDIIDLLWQRVDEIQYLDDPGRCPVDWIEHMLYELGNPFRFPIETELLKRRLANALPGFYKKVGTARGIKGMLYLLLGIDFDIVPYINGDYWRLGYSELGIETVLGPGTAWAKNAYEVISPIVLTAAQRRVVTDVCTWADPADMHLVRIVEPPDDTSVVGRYWILGESALGISTTLSG